MTTAQSDERLMSEVTRGSRTHLEPLVRRYSGPLLTFIQRMIGNHHRSEELFQEVFLVVWKKRKQYQPWRPFKPWLYAIALNIVRAELRFRPPRPVLSLDDPFLMDARLTDREHGDTLVATETGKLVREAVKRLPVKQQTVICLRLWSGLSYGEIARTLGKTEGTVRSNMHHGLARLREYLEPRLR